MPGEKAGSEFPDALEPIGKEPDDADEGIDHHDDVSELRTFAGSKSSLDPLSAGHSVGPPQPGRKIDHQEDLVKRRPQPRDPYTLQSIDKHPVDKQHGSADVKHAGGVRNAQDVPWHAVAAQE